MCSWGSGADLWGSEVDSRYGKPRIDDGLLEVVGVTGVVHMVRYTDTHTLTHTHKMKQRTLTIMPNLSP